MRLNPQRATGLFFIVTSIFGLVEPRPIDHTVSSPSSDTRLSRRLNQSEKEKLAFNIVKKQHGHPLSPADHALYQKHMVPMPTQGNAPPAPAAQAHNSLVKNNKAQVSKFIGDAAKKMEKTKNIPDRKATFNLGPTQWSGAAARTATMHSYLHENKNMGIPQPVPKNFQNKPYPADHAVPSLQNQHPKPLAHKHGLPLKEYPLGQAGQDKPWAYGQPMTKGRVLTSKTPTGQNRFMGVIGHDDAKDPAHPQEHYRARMRKKQPREVDLSKTFMAHH